MSSGEHLFGFFAKLWLLSVGIARRIGKDCLPLIEGLWPACLRGSPTAMDGQEPPPRIFSIAVCVGRVWGWLLPGVAILGAWTWRGDCV